jgi:glutamine cyclotransferase
MQRIGYLGSLLFLALTALSLTACNGSPAPNVSGTPLVESAPITASPTPVLMPTPIPSVTPTPSATPTATPAANCTVTNLSFAISDSITRSVSGLTEGFSIVDGTIYESTGAISGHGPSVLNSIDVRSGWVTKLISTPNSSFGEGLVKLGDYFYQLTYTDGKIYKYTSDGTAAGTRLVGTYPNPLSEGWGLTTDGTDLLASDGSAYLYRIDPATLMIKSKVKVVNAKGVAITGLNELEYVNGQIYANIFPSARMVRFDAIAGCQTGEITLSAIQKSINCAMYSLACNNNSVPNGIAYDSGTQAFYITGKSWPFIYKGQFQ